MQNILQTSVGKPISDAHEFLSPLLKIDLLEQYFDFGFFKKFIKKVTEELSLYLPLNKTQKEHFIVSLFNLF